MTGRWGLGGAKVGTPPLLAKDARNAAPRNAHCQVKGKGSGRGRPLHTGVASRRGQPRAAVPTWVRVRAGFVAGGGVARLRRVVLHEETGRFPSCLRAE